MESNVSECKIMFDLGTPEQILNAEHVKEILDLESFEEVEDFLLPKDGLIYVPKLIAAYQEIGPEEQAIMGIRDMAALEWGEHDGYPADLISLIYNEGYIPEEILRSILPIDNFGRIRFYPYSDRPDFTKKAGIENIIERLNSFFAHGNLTDKPLDAAYD